MTQYLKKTLIFLAISLGGATASAQGYCGGVVGVTSIDQFSVTSFLPNNYRQRDYYDDLYARCTTYLHNFEQALFLAMRKYNQNDIRGGNNKIINTLAQMSSDIQYGQGDLAYAPADLLRAIVHASEITQAYKVALLDPRNAPFDGPGALNQSAQVSLKFFLAQVVKIIQSAGQNLNQQYFSNVTECMANGYCYSRRSPYSYFDQQSAFYTKQLAFQFVDLLVRTGRTTLTDALELKVISSVSAAAAKILNRSIFRRDYACEVVNLWNIHKHASNFACDTSNPRQTVADVDSMRQAVAQVHWSLSRPDMYYGCGGGYDDYHDGGYQEPYPQQDPYQHDGYQHQHQVQQQVQPAIQVQQQISVQQQTTVQQQGNRDLIQF